MDASVRVKSWETGNTSLLDSLTEEIYLLTLTLNENREMHHD